MAATITPETPLTFATCDELAELLTAIDDRLEIEADADRRARLARGRGLLERQLSRRAQRLARLGIWSLDRGP